MKTTKLLFIAFIAAIIFYSCKDNPVNPEDNLQPGRRDYTWKVDTIKIPNNYSADLRVIWGSSPSDIWVAGPSFTYKYTMWHYDGNNWTPNAIASPSNPTSIYGFASNDIWIGYVNGSLYHYNGFSWTKDTTIIIDKLGQMVIQNIWGNSSNDVYAVGYAGFVGGDYKGIIAHFDGRKWNVLDIPDTKTIFLKIRKANNINNNYLIQSESIQETQPGRLKLYALNGTKVNQILKTQDAITLSRINEQTYVGVNKKIYKFNNNLEIWKDLSATNFPSRGWTLWGRTENDFFTMNDDGIAHYNGTDLVTLYKTGILFIQSALIFNSDVYFDKVDPNGTNIIIHGKLK